jgi:hypothetical protein
MMLEKTEKDADKKDENINKNNANKQEPKKEDQDNLLELTSETSIE